MKRLIALMLVIALLLCGCSFEQAADTAFQTLLEKIASNQKLQNWLADYPLEQMTAAEAQTTLVEKFPVLEDLLNFDNLNQLLKTTGLDLVAQYVSSSSPEAQEKAETLGAIIQILYPDLADEVEAIVGK